MDELQEVTKKLSFLPLIYKKMIVRQLVFGVSGAIALGILFDIHAGISLLAGVMPVVIGVLVASPIANKKNNDNPGGIVINALKAEAVKIFLILALMWLEFKFYNDLVPMALVVGLVMAALISGIAISHIDNIKIDNKE
ncbi:ATP synthase subunit I [Methylophilaceae bacterium]|jgi:ATP synthase protein I|nr:ATP synthase subunit I [Nitrosomonadales bacterium]MBT6140421.1 ATP synthase subunit I [Nitrosomonadales bacterium]MDB9717237.1 ATP synthase subunit I [Methylophilaceae bacterium]MDC0115194.1 ATP synthase subunit I [Methylophilaceae bacterium]